jgi:hypothetical protein
MTSGSHYAQLFIGLGEGLMNFLPG